MQLFNRIQLHNDRTLVANGIALRKIMAAAQEETKVSRDLQVKAHKLSEDMKRDSLSMKTVCSELCGTSSETHDINR